MPPGWLISCVQMAISRNLPLILKIGDRWMLSANKGLDLLIELNPMVDKIDSTISTLSEMEAVNMNALLDKLRS